MTELSVLPGGRFWTRCVPPDLAGGQPPPCLPPDPGSVLSPLPPWPGSCVVRSTNPQAELGQLMQTGAGWVGEHRALSSSQTPELIPHTLRPRGRDRGRKCEGAGGEQRPAGGRRGQRVRAAGPAKGLYLAEASAAPAARCWAQESAPAWPWPPLRLYPKPAMTTEAPGGKTCNCRGCRRPLPASSPPGPFLPCKSGPWGGTGSLGTLRKGGLSCQLCC